MKGNKLKMRTKIGARLQERRSRVLVGAKKMPTVDTSGRFKTKNKKHSTKVTKNLQIEDFRIGVIHISVDWYSTADISAETLYMCRQCFEQWLNDTGKLETYTEMTDWTGDYLQDYSAMAVEEYWDNADYTTKLKHLRQYIVKEGLV